jgi:hypothetical protein
MYYQLTNRSAGVSVLVVIQLVEVQTIQEVIGHFSRRTAEPPAPRLGRFRLQDTDTTSNQRIHTYIHTPCCTFAASVELVTVAGVGGYGPPGGASVFDWKACRWVPAEEVGLAKSKLSGFKAALVARLSGWLCFRLDENEKKRRGDTVIFTY